MAIYEYNCPACGAGFELMRPMSQSNAAATCPHCAAAATRALSPFSCTSRDAGGNSTPVGGSSCSGCASSSCAGCGG